MLGWNPARSEPPRSQQSFFLLETQQEKHLKPNSQSLSPSLLFPVYLPVQIPGFSILYG